MARLQNKSNHKTVRKIWDIYEVGRWSERTNEYLWRSHGRDVVTVEIRFIVRSQLKS